MRRVTRNLVLGILAVVVLLLALGSVPGLLRSGDPYYVTATPVGEAESVTVDDADGPAATDTAVPGRNASTARRNSTAERRNRTTVAAASLSPRTYPYTTAALADASPNATGRSGPYWRGPVGVKEAFTHSPFDELAALRQQYPDVARDDGVLVARNGTLYRVTVAR